MFAPIFICPTHGETWHIERVESFDTDRDDVYEYTVCQKCGSEVKPLEHEGHQVCHVLSDDEMFWEMQSDNGEL